MKKLCKGLILLVIGCLFSVSSFASGGIKCSDWINANIGTGDAISSAGYLLDGSGGVGEGNVSVACRDVSWVTGGRYSSGGVMGFPYIWSRVKLVRQGSDAFSSSYSLTSQLCGFRDVTNHMECSYSFFRCSGRWYDSSSWSCSWVALGDAWGETSSSTPVYMYNGSSSISKKDITFRGEKYCLKRFTKGDTMSHGGTYTGSQDYMCAYTGGDCSIPRAICLQSPIGQNEPQCWLNELIGCVHELPRPSPPIYNVTLVQVPEPYVDQGSNQIYTACTGISDADLYSTCVLQNYYVQTYNSKFHQPVIALKQSAYGVQGSSSYVPENTLTLRYVYSGDAAIDSLPSCGTMSGITYCAVSMSSTYPTVPSSQVCVCNQDYCSQGSYIGCVPRPNLKQSGYALVVDYVNGYEPNNFITAASSSKSNPAPNAKVNIVQTDSIGPLIYDASNARVRKWPADRKYYRVDTTTGAFHMLSGSTTAIDPLYIAQYPVHYGSSLSATFTDGNGDSISSIGEYATTYSPTPTLSSSRTRVAFANPSYPVGYTLDNMNTYGASMAAIMPQMSSSTNQPIIAEVYSTAPAYESTAPSSTIRYSMAPVANMSSTGPINYYVPDGSRYRMACNGIHNANGGALCSGDCVQCTYSNGNASYFQDYTTPPATIRSAFCQNDASGVILTPTTTPASQCCAGRISAYVTQGYAESAVCAGAYISDYAERNSNYLINSSSISAVSGGSSTLYSSVTSLPNGSVPFTNVNNTNSSTGSAVYQAQNICIYAADWDFIGYNLNSDNSAYDDPLGLNTYLCDHIPQRCELINLTTSTPTASVYMPIENIAQAGTTVTATGTGYASWPKTEYDPASTRLVGTTATGSCFSGYSMANGSTSPTRACLDGQWGAVSANCLSKCVIPTSGASLSTVGYGMNFANAQPSGNSVLGTSPSQYLVSGVTATATSCSDATKPAANGVYPSITCGNDGTFSVTNSCAGYCSVSAGTSSAGYGTGFTVLGTSSPYISAGTTATATGCATDYNKSGSSWPRITCDGTTGVLSVSNACTPSCNITNGSSTVGYGTFSSTTIASTATATSCATGYVSTTGAMPSVTCNAGVLSAVSNPCVAGCAAFSPPTGTTGFSDTSNAKASGTVLTGSCDTAKGYYSSCSAPSGAATIDPGKREVFPSCSRVSDTITYTCSGTEWVTSDSCGNSSCKKFDYGGRGEKGKTDSGDKGELNCGDDYKDPPTYYCRNGTWSFTDNDGGGGTGSDGVCKRKSK